MSDNSAVWFVAGVAVGALALSMVRKPDLDGCCYDLAAAARDKIDETIGGGRGKVGRALDRLGLTQWLPNIIGALR